jgi:hypothetical protein
MAWPESLLSVAEVDSSSPGPKMAWNMSTVLRMDGTTMLYTPMLFATFIAIA